jgi:hypothetical protein
MHQETIERAKGSKCSNNKVVPHGVTGCAFCVSDFTLEEMPHFFASNEELLRENEEGHQVAKVCSGEENYSEPNPPLFGHLIFKNVHQSITSNHGPTYDLVDKNLELESAVVTHSNT